MNCKNHYLDIFNVTESGLKEITAKALSRGGDFADLYFEYTTFFNLNLKDGVVSSGGFHTDYGVGIRVLKGEKTGIKSWDSQFKVSTAKTLSRTSVCFGS